MVVVVVLAVVVACLIYLVDGEDRAIYLLWIYIHAEFEGRPPGRELCCIAKNA